MAATRCANPVVSVIGACRSAKAAATLAGLLDAAAARTWQEGQIDTSIDLGAR